MLHLDDSTDLSWHRDRPILLALEIEALQSVVHSSDYNGFVKLDEANRFSANFFLKILM